MAVIFGGRSALTVCLLTVLVLSSLMWEVADGGKGRRRSGRRRKRGNDKCSTSSVAEYKLTFYGAWSKEKFPRMYPRYRPPAQWSKLVVNGASEMFDDERRHPAIAQWADSRRLLVISASLNRWVVVEDWAVSAFSSHGCLAPLS